MMVSNSMALTLYLSLYLSVSETIEIDTGVNIDVDRKNAQLGMT